VKVTVLGCGGSGGVPLIGPEWGSCDPANPKNRRRRVSVLVEEGDTTILIDTSPDLRAQLLDAKVNRLSAVVWTHHHADHLNGIDDLRPVNRYMKRPIDVYGSAETLAHIEHSFGYVLKPIPPGDVMYKPYLIPHEIKGPFRIGDVPVLPFRQDHGFSTTLGLRFGSFAYSTDVKGLDEAAFKALEGLDLWIVDCLRDAPHPTHSHFAQTMEWIRRVKPRRAVLTHMNHEADYATWAMRLPPGIEPGYDGLTIELDVPWTDRDPGGYYARYMREEDAKKD
jgi:phosphoribosyl 1,2-cyclic phosphate phosphodiesterase